ncbi:hypothetical protein [Streptomyces sp. NPDC047042]|uniref:hypothetical protein n=1 Tax=Streptomyces sp. NPDC047042 TaxID=3154807 RepID=UPI00340FDD60
MSMIKNRRNQEPEPVRPWVARLFRRPAPEARLQPLRNGEALAAILRQAEALRTAKSNAERWKGHADSFAKDLRAAVDTLADRTRERDDSYRECAQLLAWITALHPANAVIAPAHDSEGSQDLYIVAGGWQLSWPIPAQDADLFRHVAVVDVTDPRAQWDGHGPVQRDERIRNHVRLLVLDAVADGSLTGVTGEVRSA